MNPFDETPPPPDRPQEQPHDPALESAPSYPAELVPPPFPPAAKTYPEDLQISWSWLHFLFFAFFGVISLVLIQTVLAVYLIPHRQGMNPNQLEKYLISNPKFSIGSMLIWYVALFFFLYVTLSLLRGVAFWRSLGWRRLLRADGTRRKPLAFFLFGCGLSLMVAIASSQMKTPDNLPVEELFKNRQTAILFMAMAVVVAPLVEETLFRGYLYPLLARSFGIAPGILITGVLFGAMHGAQLGWTWTLVSVLIFVGIVFTLVRARTGSVFASYLMHLGYNSLISFFAIVGTQGFTKLPHAH